MSIHSSLAKETGFPEISGIRGSRIRNTAQGIRNPTNDRNRESKFHRQRTRIRCLKIRNPREARVAQWWERSPPTSVARVRILASTPYVGWVCCWFSPLLREVFLRVLRFSPLLKNQHFQIPIRSGTHGHVSTSSYELLSDPWVNKLQFTILHGANTLTLMHEQIVWYKNS